MRKILLASVATIPLLSMGMLAAPAQQLKDQGSGMSQSQGMSGTKEKSSATGKMDQGRAKGGEEGAAKTGAPDKTEGRSPAGGRDEHQTVGQDQKGRAGDSQANRPADSKSKAQDQTKSDQTKSDQTKSDQTKSDQTKAKSADQAKTKGQGKDQDQASGSAKDQSQTTGSAKDQRGQGQNKANQAAGANAPKEPPTTAGQSTRTNEQTRPNEPTRTNEPTRANEQNGRSDPNARNEQSGRVEAQGSVTLNEDQRTKIRETVLSGRDVPRVDRVNFEIEVGRVVPREVRIREVPSTLVEIHPEWRGHEFFVVRDEIVIVDRSRKVMARVPVGTSSSRVETRGNSSVSVTEEYSPQDIRRIQQVLIEKNFYRGPVDGVFHPELKEALITFQRQEGIEATGRIDERTVTSLGVSVSTHTEGQAGSREGDNGNRTGGSQGSRDANDQKSGQNSPAGANEQRPSTAGQAGSGQAGGGQGGNAQQPGARNDQSKSNESNTSGPATQQRPSTSGQGGSPSSTNQGNAPTQQQGGATFTPSQPGQGQPSGPNKGGASDSQRKQP